jgi:ornithine carbamoyltransferase
MIFDKPSTRTRVSFDVGMRQLGGETIMLTGTEMQLGRSETIADTAKVLSRYVDAIMIRTTSHDRLIELTENATIPVINGLTDDTHPCQLMADIMTFEEHRGSVAGRTFAWSGDGNNVLHSLLEASARFRFNLNVAVPEGSEPGGKFVDWSRANGGEIRFTRSAEEAVDGADCVVTDTWVSMGAEHRARGHNVFMPYQVNGALMARAKPDALFMHCLPAHRGDEVTDEVIDGPHSVVFDEAENRLHAQKAVLAWCLGA